MGSERIYRRLFFIRILHGFFLDTDGVPYYTLTPEKIDQQLGATVANGQYTLMNDLIIQPSEETNAILKGHRLLYRVLPHGLLVGCAVNDETVNGVLKSKPVIPVNTSLRLQFYISSRNAFKNYSSTRIDPVIPAAYYFTNDNSKAGINYPSLSVPVMPVTEGRFYQMGETAIINGKCQQAALPTKKSATGWADLKLDKINYVSEYDRILVKKKFNYLFDVKGIKEANFELQQNGQVVKAIKVSDNNSLSEVMVDLEAKDDKTPIEDGRYQLKVSGTDNYIWESELYLDNQLYVPGRLAVLDIALHTEDPKFSALDKDGYLQGQDESVYPTMELRFLNRSTYWKYYFQQKGPTKGDPLWIESLLPKPPGIDKVIVSTKPRPLTKALQKVKYDQDLLPNPSEQRLGMENDGVNGVRICSEILLTKIKL
jgi:hypothetical protein